MGAVVAICLAQMCVCGRAMGQDDGDRTYRSATGLLNRGMNELAAEEYRAFLKDHAGDARAPTARYGLGVCLSRLGKHAEAAEQLQQVAGIKGFEFAADAELLLGQCLLLCDKPEEAAEVLGRFVKGNAEHKQADAGMALLGEAQLRAGKGEEAAKTFAALAKKWPESPARERADLLWAMCESGEGKAKEAAQRLSELRERFPEGASAGQAMLLEAQCRHRLGETKRALELYRAVAEGKDAALKPEALLGTAQLTRAGGKPKDARRMLEQVLAKGAPATAPAARVELARCLLDEDRAQDALGELAKLPTEIPPTLTDDVAYWSARCETKLGKYEEAAARLEGCEKRFAKSELLADMMYERAEALGHEGKQAESAAAFAALRARFPDNALAAEAALAQAVGAYQAGDDATARGLCEEFLKKDGAHARAATAELIVAECDYRAEKLEQAEREYARFVERHPEDANAWRATVRRGLCLARLGKSDEAGAVLEPALADRSGTDKGLRVAAQVALGDAAFAAGDWKKAETWFGGVAGDASAAEGAVREDALLKQGLSLHRQGRAADALQVYEQLLKEFPDGKHATQATFERGQALLDLSRDEEAAACFRWVLEVEQSGTEKKLSVHAKRHLAAIASRAGKTEEAAGLLGEVAAESGDAKTAARVRLDQGMALLSAGKYAEAEAVLSELARGGDPPGAAEAAANRAIAVSRQGRLEEAMKGLEAARGIEGLTPGTRESVAYERASVLAQLQRDDEARAAYEELLALQPSARLATHGALGLAQLDAKAEKFAECLRDVEAVERSAAEADAATREAVRDHTAYLRGLSEYRLGKNAQAVKTLSKLLKERAESPVRPAAALVCGEAMLKLGQAENAARLFQEVAAASREAEVAGPALLRLGEACAAAQNWAGSEAAFNEFLSRFAESPVWFQARFGIGWARENQGKQEAALEAYRAVVAKHDGPTAARAQFQIGECLFALKKYDEAVKELLRVDILYAYPEWSAAALLEAGRCLAEQGKQAEAREQYEQVVKRFADTTWGKAAAKLISETRPAPVPGRGEKRTSK